MLTGSRAFDFSKTDALKTLKGLGIGMFGAALAYGLQHLGGVNLGSFTPLFVVAASTVFNAAIKYFSNTQAEVTPVK